MLAVAASVVGSTPISHPFNFCNQINGIIYMNIEQAEKKLVFKCIAGSHAYGTNVPTSDTDYRGVFMLPATHYLRLDNVVDQVSNSKNDWTYYAMRRFLHLATNANPNILELLFMPEDVIQFKNDVWDQVIVIREKFISKRVLFTYGGYAVAQIKKARGQNKMVHNPQPERKPVKEDFCWIIPLSVSEIDSSGRYDISGKRLVSPPLGDKMPCRPIPYTELKDKWFRFDQLHAAALEHAHNMYRVYRVADAKGIFRGDDTLCMDSITIAQEGRFQGILIYNREAYELAVREWHKYWDWVNNRNNARWLDQERGQMDYDAKNMSHCFRLLYEGLHILENGIPKVRFEGEQLQKLKDIRAGKYPYDDLIEEADEMRIRLDEARMTCKLPATADLKEISTLSEKLHLEWKE